MINRKLFWYEKSRDFTPEEMMSRTMAVEECRQITAKLAFFRTREERGREMDELWVRKPENRLTASYGTNWGFYVGYDAIREYYVEKHEKDRIHQAECYAAAGETSELRKGLSSFRVINTPCIYIARDGKTAQSLWYSCGTELIGKPGDDAEGWWLYLRTAVDYMLEDGEWKIWHVYDCYDCTCPIGTDFSEYPTFPTAEQEWARWEFESGNPTIKMITHENAYHTSDGWPRIPGAHDTYSIDNSCGADAHPGLQDEPEDVEWLAYEASKLAWGR